MAAAAASGRLLSSRGWLPSQLIVRHGSKAVTRHRKPLHILRQKLMAVTEYIPPKPAIPERCTKPRQQKVQEPSTLEKLIWHNVEIAFQENKMIAVFQNNSINSEELRLLRHRLLKHDIRMKFFPNQAVPRGRGCLASAAVVWIIGSLMKTEWNLQTLPQILRSYLTDTKYKNLLPLFIGHNIIIVSKEPKTKELLQIVRSTTQISLLGACIEDALFSKQGVVKYSRLPGLQVIRGEVVSGLTQMTSQTCQLLNNGPVLLTTLLEQYLKQQNDAGTGQKESAKLEQKETLGSQGS